MIEQPVAKVPFDIELDGKVWKVAHPTRAARDALAAMVLQHAWANLKQTQTVLPDGYAELLAEMVRLIGAEEYKTGGKAWGATVNGPSGNALFVLSLLREHHPDASLKDARKLIGHRPDDVQVALAALVPGFFLLVGEDDEIPPERRAEMAALAAEAGARPKPLTT